MTARRRTGALLSVIGALVASLLVASPASAEPPSCDVVDPEGTGVILLREGKAFPVTVYCDSYPARQQDLQIAISTPPEHGTAGSVTFVPQFPSADFGSHEVTYDPENGYVGLDAFTLTVSDGTESTDVFVDLEMVPNTAPACHQSSETRWGHAEVATAYDWSVLCGDWDLQDQTLQGVVTEPPLHGLVQTAVVDTMHGPSLDVRYTPEPDYVGADTFRAGITDGDLTTVMEFRIHVSDGPWCADESTPLEVVAGRTGRLFTYCSDPDLTWPTNLQVVDPPDHGTVELDGAVIDYTADPDASGTDSFSYRMTSDLGVSNVVTQTVEITPNAAPVCVPVTTATPRDTPTEVPLSCSDPDGDELEIAVTGAPKHGTLTPLVDGTVTYSPEKGYDGKDTFTFEAADFARSSGPTTVTVAVTEDDAPVITVSVEEQSPARAARRGLLAGMYASERVTADVVVRVPARVARRLDLGTRVIGTLTRDAEDLTRLTVPLTRRAEQAVRDVRRLPVRVTVAATDGWGNATTKGRRAVLR